MAQKDECPICGEKAVTTVTLPDRKVNLSRQGIPAPNNNQEGDKVKCHCGFCGWWSEGTFSKNAPPPLTHRCGPRCYKKISGTPEPVHDCQIPDSEAYKNGPGWVWKTSPPPSQKQKMRLEQRLKKIKKQRGKRGF